MNTPRTDKLYEDVWRFTNETDAVDALISMRDFCRELERENAALRADKERLDWLDHNAIPWTWMSPEKIDGLGPIVVTWKSNRTLRAAIDAARKEAQP